MVKRRFSKILNFGAVETVIFVRLLASVSITVDMQRDSASLFFLVDLVLQNKIERVVDQEKKPIITTLQAKTHLLTSQIT